MFTAGSFVRGEEVTQVSMPTQPFRRPPHAAMLTIDRQIDRRILLEAESLAKAGWEVTIVAPNARLERSGYPERQHPFEVNGAPPARQRIVGSVYRLLRDTLPMGERGTRRLREIGWRYLFDQEKFYRDLFARPLDGLRPDVFIAHDLPTLPPAHRAAREAGARLIYDSHELYVEQELSEFEKRSWSAIERRYIPDCDAVVTVNPSIASEIAERYALEHVEVVYNAERRRPASGRSRYFHEKYDLPESARVLLMQGGLSSGRNIETLVGAMELVGNPDIHLVIMGGGPLRGRLAAMAARSRVAARVHLHERVAQCDLLAHTAAADAGVIPYQATCLNNYYCTPNKLFEFISAGVAVLSSDLPEIRRIVDEHQIGLLADLGREEPAARAIDAVFSDPARLARWRGNTAAASAEVSWDVEGAKFVAIVERVLAERRPRSVAKA